MEVLNELVKETTDYDHEEGWFKIAGNTENLIQNNTLVQFKTWPNRISEENFRIILHVASPLTSVCPRSTIVKYIEVYTMVQRPFYVNKPQ